MVTVDVPNESLRLSTADGELLMIVDLTDEAVERVLAEFKRLADPWTQPRMPVGSHPDYEPWVGAVPF